MVSHQGLVLGLRSGVKNKAFFKKKMLFEEQVGLTEKQGSGPLSGRRKNINKK